MLLHKSRPKFDTARKKEHLEQVLCPQPWIIRSPTFGTNAAVIVDVVVAFPVAARIVGLCTVVCSPLTVLALVA